MGLDHSRKCHKCGEWFSYLITKCPHCEPKPFKLDVSKEWCEKMAKLEGDCEIGAGAVARDHE